MPYAPAVVERTMKVQQVLMQAISGQLTWLQAEEILGWRPLLRATGFHLSGINAFAFAKPFPRLFPRPRRSKSTHALLRRFQAPIRM